MYNRHETCVIRCHINTDDFFSNGAGNNFPYNLIKNDSGYFLYTELGAIRAIFPAWPPGALTLTRDLGEVSRRVDQNAVGTQRFGLLIISLIIYPNQNNVRLTL